MGTYPIQKLLQKWEQATITMEMAIGHGLQHVGQLWAEVRSLHSNIHKLTNALNETNQHQALLKADIARLLKHTGLPTTPLETPPKRKRGRPRKKK